MQTQILYVDQENYKLVGKMVYFLCVDEVNAILPGIEVSAHVEIWKLFGILEEICMVFMNELQFIPNSKEEEGPPLDAYKTCIMTWLCQYREIRGQKL